jgi:hypothetical protein
MIAPESSETFTVTPEERLGRIQDFLFETHSIRVKRVGYAEILAPLVDNEAMVYTREKILEDTHESIKQANEALDELRRETRQRLVVSNPDTGETAQLQNLAFTPNKVTYLGMVICTGATDNTIWDIGSLPLIRLQ